MPLQPIVRSIVRPTVTGIVRSFGSSFVSRFGNGLSAAYFLADLGSKRGFVHGVMNPVVRVQESVTSTLRSFTAPEVLNGTLLAWVRSFGTSADGLVYIWYDGSGNHRDATQDTVADMPKIVSAGTLVADGLNFLGSASQHLETSVIPPATLTAFSVSFNGSGNGMVFGARDSNDERSYLSELAGDYRIGVANNQFTASEGSSEIDLTTFIYNGSTSSLHKNGTSIISESQSQAVNNTTHGFTIGALNDAGSNISFFSGNIEALFLYTADKSTQRTAIETALAKEFNITLA